MESSVSPPPHCWQERQGAKREGGEPQPALLKSPPPSVAPYLPGGEGAG